MRVGYNPAKDQKIRYDAYHRVIIPVYVPNFEGYFKDGLEVTRVCISSLLKTKHQLSIITLVNNGSCQQITNYLQELYEKGMVHQLVHYKQNVGKIDAVLPIAKTASEAIITISDGDVLFKTGWMQAVEKVFEVFPEAGMVSPVPHGTTFNNYTTHTLFDALLKRNLKFQEACNPNDLLRFAKSIGKEATMYQNKIRLKYQLTVQRDDVSAVVGCGHFVASLRKEVFLHAPKHNSYLAYASSADKEYIDVPNEKAGLWRLATTGNFAYHMGNYMEDWMYDEFSSLQETTQTLNTVPRLQKNNIPFFIKKGIIRFLFSRFFKHRLYRYLGLKEAIKSY